VDTSNEALLAIGRSVAGVNALATGCGKNYLTGGTGQAHASVSS
jgi:hypothetical protein